MNKEMIEREQHNQKRIMELNKEIERLKNDLFYILEQLDGYLDKGWTIDLNFTDIREKYDKELKENK